MQQFRTSTPGVWEVYCNEIRPYWLMVTKGYGFTVDDIDWSCPADLEPYAKAHKIEQRENDTIAWLYGGNYLLSAFSVALEHCLAGDEAKSEYMKESIMSRLGEYDGLSQEEIDNREL